MIDPVTGSFEMTEIKTKRAYVIADIIKETGLNRNPWPTEVIPNRGG